MFDKFKRFYERKIEKVLPHWSFLPLIGCFLLNAFVYWSTQALMADAYHYDFTLPLDNKIPVTPWWVSIYIMSYGFWTLNYVLIARQGKYFCYRLVGADYISKLVCGVIFIVIPTTNSRPLIQGDGVWDYLLKFIYSVDSPTNLFPSIHCLVSWLCFIGLMGTKIPKWYKALSFCFAVSICISTQMTKQHYMVDLIGGILLAQIAFYISDILVKKLGYSRLAEKEN